MRASGSLTFPARLAAALICGGFILWLSLIPAASVPNVPFFGWDKLQHATAYAVLTLLCGWAFVVLRPGSRRGWQWGVLASVGFGGLVEVLQGLCTTTRSADAGDLLADAVGALGVYLAAVYAWRRKSV